MKDDLLSYMRVLVDLEKTVYTQSQLQQELRKKTETLGIPQRISSPTMEAVSVKDNLSAGMCISGLICGIIGALYGLFTSNGFFDAIFGLIGGGITGIIIGAAIGFVVGIVWYFIEKKQAEDEYNTEHSMYLTEVDEDRKRVKEEKEQAQQIRKALIALGAKRTETEQLLRKYYDVGVLHSDYHNMYAVCAIYNYLEKGICTGLKGHDGAYNLLREDQHFITLGQKMDAILSSLDRIATINVMLYNSIQEENRNIRQLIAKTDQQLRMTQQTNELLAINNYNQERALAEQRYQSGLQTYALMKLEKY